MTSSVFHYQDYHLYLRDALVSPRSLGRGPSIRAWALKLGFKSPSYLVMILQGKRNLPTRYLPALIHALKLKGPEARYFENLVHFQHSKSPDEKAMYERRLKALSTAATPAGAPAAFVSLDMEAFRFIKDPVHYFILEMTLLRGFEWDAAWIHRRLGPAYTITQVREAMERLLTLNLVSLEGARPAKTSARVTTTHDVPNSALKEFHKTLLAKASLAIDSQESRERDITASTVTVDASRLPRAKEMIRDFRRDLCKFLEASPGEGTDTYQLNVQLFRITDTQGQAKRCEPGSFSKESV